MKKEEGESKWGEFREMSTNSRTWNTLCLEMALYIMTLSVILINLEAYRLNFKGLQT